VRRIPHPKWAIHLLLVPAIALILGFCAFVVREVAFCPTDLVARAALVHSHWSVEATMTSCSMFDDAPYEIVATNVATGKKFKVAEIPAHSTPNLISFDATGRLVVSVPRGATVRDRHDTVGDLRVVYRYDP